MDDYKIIVEQEHQTVAAHYEVEPKPAEGYQSEAALEKSLIVLSNLSAGYVHQMQHGQETSYRDAVEDMFQRGFKTCLAHYDLLDVTDEVEKMKKQELN